jgi:hypothetical protein
MVSAWVWTSTHLKLQHGSLRNLNGARRLSEHCQNQQPCFLMVICTILHSARLPLNTCYGYGGKSMEENS